MGNPQGKPIFCISQGQSDRQRVHRIYASMPFLKKDYALLRTFRSSPVIVDVGCGDGAYLKRAKLIRPDAALIGVDRDCYLECIRPEELKLFCSADLERGIPLGDHSADYLHCAQVIEHLNHPDVLFSEIYRVLKKGGCAYIEAPAVITTRMPSPGTVGTLNFYDDHTHVRPYTKETFRRLAVQSGFNEKNMRLFRVRSGFNLLFLPYSLLRFFMTGYNFYLQVALQPIFALDVAGVFMKE